MAIADLVLLEHLRSGSGRRELIASRVRLAGGVVGLAMMTAAGLGGGELHPSMLSLLGGIVVFELGLGRALKRGWYRPWLPWLSTMLEVTIPAVVALFFALRLGAIVYLASGVTILWACLVSTTTLRVNPALSVMAGLLAAAEQFAISRLFVDPSMEVLAPVLMTLPRIWLLDTPLLPEIGTVNRSLFLAIAGVLSASVAWLLLQQAKDALRAVREQDLMGKYFLHEKLGAGGMAEVYRATYSPEGGFEKSVALKRVLPHLSADPEFTKLFLSEARLCSLLAHPNVVQVFDVGRYQGTYILAMELVDGLPLNKLLRAAGPFPVHAAVFVASELCAALEYVHGRIGPDGQPLALVHYDLNPPNVLVSRFGEVKLGDFGVARAAAKGVAPAEIVGKVPYMAPEQLRGDAHDGRVDVFALGLTLYELLAGQRALRGSEAEVMANVRDGKVPPISELRPGLPPELVAALEWALVPDATWRPSAAALRAKLSALPATCAPLPLGPGALKELVAGARVEAVAVAAPQPMPETVTQPSNEHETRPLRR